CVDRRGSDPVAEHDSEGELVWLAADHLRLTGDTLTARATWPHVRAAIDYLDTLRSQRRTAAWRAPDGGRYFGLLPPSISHEGYSAKPMHSYWDDFFAIKGLGDAAQLAAMLGHADEAKRFAAERDDLREDVLVSIRGIIGFQQGGDYIPGSVELNDFDPTSTTIAIAPGGELEHLPDSTV